MEGTSFGVDVASQLQVLEILHCKIVYMHRESCYFLLHHAYTKVFIATLVAVTGMVANGLTTLDLVSR